jgi:hypothetical protein
MYSPSWLGRVLVSFPLTSRLEVLHTTAPAVTPLDIARYAKMRPYAMVRRFPQRSIDRSQMFFLHRSIKVTNTTQLAALSVTLIDSIDEAPDEARQTPWRTLATKFNAMEIPPRR